MGWLPAAGASSPLTTKGDLHTYDTADARLGVGSNDQVLTADSAVGLGVKWAAVGGASVPAWISYLLERQGGETGHADDDFFDADSSADYTETADSGTAVWTYGTYDVLSVAFDNQDTTSWATSLKAIPGAGVPITIESHFMNTAVINSGFAFVGLCFTSGTAIGSEIAAYGVGHTGVDTTRWGRFNADGDTIASADWASVRGVADTNRGFGLRVIWSAADTFALSISGDFVNWTDFDFADLTRTFTPTHMGFVVGTYGSVSTSVATFDYLRVYESDLSV